MQPIIGFPPGLERARGNISALSPPPPPRPRPRKGSTPIPVTTTTCRPVWSVLAILGLFHPTASTSARHSPRQCPTPVTTACLSGALIGRSTPEEHPGG